MSDNEIAVPKAGRPQMPEGYGVPKSDKGLLPWSHAAERLENAINYWVCTVRPDGRPHAVPVWGMWVGGAIYYGGGPDARHMRNLSANPNVSVHLESGGDVVIVEGAARVMGSVGNDLAERLAVASNAKYAKLGHTAKAADYERGGFVAVTPRVVLAWMEFPKDVTRWRFET
jgi:hypothetical protein